MGNSPLPHFAGRLQPGKQRLRGRRFHRPEAAHLQRALGELDRSPDVVLVECGRKNFQAHQEGITELALQASFFGAPEKIEWSFTKSTAGGEDAKHWKDPASHADLPGPAGAGILSYQSRR